MLFIVICIVFGFLFIVSFFGDYKTKEFEKDCKYYNKITKPIKYIKEDRKHFIEYIITILIIFGITLYIFYIKVL